MTKEIEVKINGRRGIVSRADYVTAKTKDLREFGYETKRDGEKRASQWNCCWWRKKAVPK